MTATALRLEGVSKAFSGGEIAVDRLDLAIQDGELLVVVGPSGCGKSTLLRLIAGLEPVSSGRIWLRGDDVTELSPQRRDVAMVFQSYALYPHKTVRDNLAFPLRMKRVPKNEQRERVLDVARMLDLEPLLDKKPAQLSGGQQQRVALGRAMVRETSIFLLDEPLSNLDAALRTSTRAELRRLHRNLGATTIYVTHDQEEAMTLGDRIAVLRRGRVEQIAEPREIYRRPATRFVATFVGSPPMNMFEMTGDGSHLRHGALSIEANVANLPTVWLGIRPADVELFAASESLDLVATVELIEVLGDDAIVYLDSNPPLCARLPAADAERLDKRVAVKLPRERLHLFGADGARLPDIT